jgi:hypothetical protein
MTRAATPRTNVAASRGRRRKEVKEGNGGLDAEEFALDDPASSVYNEFSTLAKLFGKSVPDICLPT